MQVIQIAQYENDISDEGVVEEDYMEYMEITERLKRHQIVGLKDTFGNADKAEASIENQLPKHYTLYRRCDE
ncbi:unnamed protein product, partial [Rotaria magnacalcarata]